MGSEESRWLVGLVAGSAEIAVEHAFRWDEHRSG